MLPVNIKKIIIKEDKNVQGGIGEYNTPIYDPKMHYKDLCSSKYYYTLIMLRHNIKIVSDYYFGVRQKAKNIDLFMLTPSISSPMGPGSDSEPISLKFGKLHTFLVDSSQFGFEPLLLNDLNKVYCYLPSMRGEKSDNRHLNQFFHCEMEMRGELKELLPIIEGYVKILAETMLLMENTINKISGNPKITRLFLQKILESKTFKKITFDEAVEILIKNGKKELINFTKHGKDISHKGELELMKILKAESPIWLTNFDRDRVPFYQKPNPKNADQVLNADLLFPPIIKEAFGGEIIGAGQRQDSVKEMIESLKRQNIPQKSYEWYINLRRMPGYKTTSGFGLGVERFIAWSLGKENIRDVILYPRIKNTRTYP